MSYRRPNVFTGTYQQVFWQTYYSLHLVTVMTVPDKRLTLKRKRVYANIFNEKMCALRIYIQIHQVNIPLSFWLRSRDWIWHELYSPNEINRVYLSHAATGSPQTREPSLNGIDCHLQCSLSTTPWVLKKLITPPSLFSQENDHHLRVRVAFKSISCCCVLKLCHAPGSSCDVMCASQEVSSKTSNPQLRI